VNTKPAAGNTNRPAHEICHGGLKAAIQTNQTEKGTRYNVAFQRICRDGEEWKFTQNHRPGIGSNSGGAPAQS